MSILDLFRLIEKPKAPTVPITHLVVGLGNPGEEYERTRHNTGFLAVEAVAAAAGVRIDRAKFHALVCEATIGGVRVLLMKPQTYMNRSGIAVREAAAFYKIPPERVLVLHDEVNFDVGITRIRRKGSSGGHNGLKSIIGDLSSEAFMRIKIGVGKKPDPAYDLVYFVLGKFSEGDYARLMQTMPKITDAVGLILAGKIDDAMMKYSK